jgi:ABC-type amino acid transport substrate-binding protein
MKALIFSLLLISSNLFAQTTLKLSSDIWPPFTDLEGKKSIALDIVSTALKRMAIKTEYAIIEFHEVISGIQSKKYDGSAALWKTSEREETMNYSLPYLQNQLILIGRKGSKVNISSISELKGKRLGLVKDWAYGDSITQAEGVDVVFGENDQSNLERLLSNKVDFMLVDAILIQYLFKYELNDVSELLEIADHPFIIKSLFFAIRKDIPNSKEIIKNFDLQIDTMISDYTYNKILNMDWIQVDMDGDGKTEYVLNGKHAGNQKPDDNTYEVFLEKKKKSESNRYFINGSYYESWEKVPNQFKSNSKTSPKVDPNNSGLKLNF